MNLSIVEKKMNVIIKNEKNPLKQTVIDSLRKYKDDPNGEGIGHGYNIMRYSKMGLIKVDYHNAQEFIDWYPHDPAFVILRLAKRGLLSYKEQQ
jgi:hypothetical protein